ncbi:MAG: phospholipid carrier-dependent glycosyltransferase [Chloroflexota bacterium]
MFVDRSGPVNPSGVTASSRETPRNAGFVPFWRFPRSGAVRESTLLFGVLVAAVLVLRGPSISQGFTIDESRWISTSRYFWITFIDRDIFGPAWQPNYLVYTHPPVARYAIGLGLWLQGWTPEQLNGRYDSLQSRAFNERAGNVPDLDLLLAARRVTRIFGVIAVILIYVVGRQLGGIVAGLAAVALTLVNPLLTTVWTRALAESVVAAFSLGALALSLAVMPYVGLPRTRPWLPLTVGAALALAAATKLNGGLGALGLSLFGLIQQGFAVRITRRTRGLRAWVDVGLVAVVLFVAVNPLLYVRPAERALALLQHRKDEMEFQRAVFSAQAVPDGVWPHVSRVAWRTFETYATPSGPLPFSPDVLLVAAGVGVLAWHTVSELRRRQPGPLTLFGCWLVTTYALVTQNLGFDSSHYYAPLVSSNVIVGGVAVAALLDCVWPLVGRRLAGRMGADAQNVQTPAT